jgi:hypothetical protein
MIVSSETLPSRLPVENVLQRRPAHLRRVGEQLPQLADLLLDGQVLSGFGRRRCLGCHVCHFLSVFLTWVPW